jgi:hypothetical protein
MPTTTTDNPPARHRHSSHSLSDKLTPFLLMRDGGSVQFLHQMAKASRKRGVRFPRFAGDLIIWMDPARGGW